MKKQKKTSIEQALDDLIKVGVPNVEEIKKYLKENINELNKAEKLFQNHIYPNKNLKWIKLYKQNLEISKYISTTSFSIFNCILKLINKDNLIQISHKEISKIANIKNKTYISNSINELIINGFITVKIKGNTRRNTIYMINPELVTIGTGNQELLKIKFWKLTGTEYKNNNIINYSKIHKNWINLNTKQNYIVGYDKLEINNETIYFNKLSQKEKTSVPLLKNTDEKNLPF